MFSNQDRTMSLDGFDRLFADADDRRPGVPVAAAGGDDETVIAALRLAADRGWVTPTLVGPGRATRATAEVLGIGLDGFRLVDAEGDAIASAAVAEVRQGRAQLLMKGRIATPALMRAVLEPESGLRTGRVVCQVVLMEISRDGRRFLMADTGITVRPKLEQKADILRSAAGVGRALGADRPRVALMAATESLNVAMPETVDAAELQARGEKGEFPGCAVQGPLSFDLAYAADAGDKKRVGGEVVGAADVMVFPDLLSANLTVKAVMYTADCRFGGVLRGTSAPVVFMSRADTAATRLHSLALALRVLERGDGAPAGG
jgi:phosphotransacetylase